MRGFSIHAFDESTSDAFSKLTEERATSAKHGFGAPDTGPVDPETAARSYLDQALESAAMPELSVSGQRSTDFMRLGTETVPLTGTTVVKFRQTVDKVPVYGSLIAVELDEQGQLLGLDSNLGEPDTPSPIAKVAPADALQAVSKHGDDRKVLDGVAPGLHFYYDEKRSKWRLAYILENVKVEQAARSGKPSRSARFEPPHFMDYVVDAHTGKVVTELPRTPSAAEEQQAVDGLGATRRFRVETAGKKATLEDTTLHVTTHDFNFRDPVVDATSLPGTVVANPPKWKPEAVSAHANACAVAEFLQTVLMRNGIDNKGGVMVSTIKCVVAEESPSPQEWHNAFWDPQRRQMVYGQALGDDGLRSLSVNIDIVAHEMFHGVTDTTSRLEYANQSGALNESYSDIFGVIVSNLGKADPRDWNWELGDGLLDDRVAFRDLSNPPRFGHPDHMNDFRHLPNTYPGDYGGVHINSGIHNKAGYNMLTATDAAGKVLLTPTEVAGFLYLALTQRLTRTSKFTDSRRAVVDSARSLFRNLAADERNRKVAAVEKAFDDVGI